MAQPVAGVSPVLLPLSVPILAVVFILSFIAAITEVPVASLLLRDVDSYGRGYAAISQPAKLFVGRLCRRRRSFRYSYHPRVPVGATLAGQWPDGSERLSFIEVPARQRAMPLPSTYVIPTYGRILALFGALFYAL